MTMEEKLIEAVRKNRELYDTRHDNYMNTKLKKRIWNDIAGELNLKDGEEAKWLWLKLRASFRDARRRHQKCLKSGSSVQDIKPWRFQKPMAFLEAFMSSGTHERSTIEDSDANDDSYPLPETSKNDSIESNTLEFVPCKNEGDPIADEEDTPELVNIEQPLNDDINRKRTIVSPPPLITLNPSRKRKKCDNIQSLLNYSIQLREERARQRAEERRKLYDEKKNAEDPLYNFFMSMYLVTKNMPPRYQHTVRAQVFQSVSDTEAVIMNMSNDRPSPASAIHHELQIKQESANDEL